MYNKLKRISRRIDKTLRIRGLRHEGMSSGNKRVMTLVNSSNKSRRYLLHHMRVHLRLKTKVSTMVRNSELSLPFLKEVRHKGVVRLLHVLGIVEKTRVSVVMGRPGASSAGKKVTS